MIKVVRSAGTYTPPDHVTEPKQIILIWTQHDPSSPQGPQGLEEEGLGERSCF